MGLDMYLYAERYLSRSDWGAKDSRTAKEAEDATKIINQVGFPVVGDYQGVYVKAQVAYWRKANAIHKWFVDKVQNGKDECEPHRVSREKLTELRDTCQRVYDHHELAEELLPPQSGFFFGSTELDQWYFDDLARTIEQIDRVLDSVPEDADLIYQSSW